MTKPFTTEQLLKLHYIYPLPMIKLQKLLQYIKLLERIPCFPSVELSKLLNIKREKIELLQRQFVQLADISLMSHYEQQGILAIPFTDEYYPKKLLQLPDAPVVLYTKGNVKLLTHAKKIAVIGSRNVTPYSQQALECLIPPLIEDDYVIVSGLAKGADTLAHKATMYYGGKTIAVLGHGLQHIYPKENAQLATKIANGHLLVTEYPPYVGIEKWHFPMRNRIISGLSDALVVTEAAMRSGTLITTEHALEQGKDVFVVPGPITSEQSKGTNYLLKEGAIPVWNGYQILEELQMFSSFH
ncbi:MAG: DNA-processing protein DprA [Solibacillus sp.]